MDQGSRDRRARLGDPNAGGAAICSVTGFPRIVGSLWRGVGRRRGPPGEFGVEALLAQELGHEFVRGEYGKRSREG